MKWYEVCVRVCVCEVCVCVGGFIYISRREREKATENVCVGACMFVCERVYGCVRVCACAYAVVRELAKTQ